MQLKDAQKINPHTINVFRVFLLAVINTPQRPTKIGVISKWCIAVTMSLFAKAEGILHILPYVWFRKWRTYTKKGNEHESE